MRGESYRLHSDSLAIRTSNGRRCTTTIPAGEIVVVLDGPIGAKRLVEVDWNNEVLLMFVDDLQHSETSFFSEARTENRDAKAGVVPTDSQQREQALIEHSIDLAESSQELERFAFGAAHDLREPLRSIQAMMELFLRRHQGKLDAESANMLHFVVDGAKRMNTLIQDLLEFAVASERAEAVEVATGEVVALAIQNLSQAIKQSGTIVEIESLPEVRANKDQLLRLFQNLISNAIKYRSQSAPIIRISASSNKDEWTFSVCDNGLGIDPAYHDQIFDAFRRVNKTSGLEGSGVGLAICKRIIDQYNGRIWVESEPGRGSTFYFTIPKSMDSSTDDRASNRKPPHKSGPDDKIRAAGQ